MRVSGYLGEDMGQVPAIVRRLEALGIDRANAAEIKVSPMLLLAIAAEHSSAIELGTSINIAFARSPAVMALEAWNLQKYSNGRISVGLGTQVKGHIEKRYGMTWSKAAGPRMREYIQVMRAVFDTFQNNSQPNFRGEHYTFTLMTPFFNAGPIPTPPPKILLAGVGDYMSQVAGEVADGILLHSFNTPKYLREVQVPAIEKGLAKAERSRASFEVAGGPWIITGRNREEIERARQPVREAIAFYGSTRTYGGVWEVHGWGEMTARLHEMSLRGEWKAMSELITDDMLDQFAVIGGPDEIVPQLLERYSGLVDSLPLPGVGEDSAGSVYTEAQLESMIAALHAAPTAGFAPTAAQGQVRGDR